MANFHLSEETVRLINWFWENHSNYSFIKGDEKIDLHSSPCLCQCETEEFFAMSEGEGELRAFLMISVFVDQMMWTHFRTIYRPFGVVFKFPKLNDHPHVGMASPGWLVSPQRGFDKKMDWKHVFDISKNILGDLFRYEAEQKLENRFQDNFLNKAVMEIEDEFDPSSSRKFRLIVENLWRPST
jgi:hypothetical protein